MTPLHVVAEESLSVFSPFHLPLKLLGVVLLEIPDHVLACDITIYLPEADDIGMQDMSSHTNIIVAYQAIQQHHEIVCQHQFILLHVDQPFPC